MRQAKNVFTTRDLTLSALFCALTAVLSQISIPIEPVPFSFGIMGVLLTSAILDTKNAFASQLVYLLLGAAGVPVFAQFQSGPQRLIGPTGGYLFSYALVALLCGLLFQFVFRSRGPVESVLVLLFGLSVCYLCGTAWLALLMGISFRQALAVGVLPFVTFDLVKVILSGLVGVKIRRTLLQAHLLDA